MDDILTIDTSTEKISGARIFMAQELKRNGELLVTAKVEAAIVGESAGRGASPRSGSPLPAKELSRLDLR